MIRWALYEDASRSKRVDHGAFPTRWLRGDEANKTSGDGTVFMTTQHLQVVDAVRIPALAWLDNCAGEEEKTLSFGVSRAALAIASNADENAADEMFCVLERDLSPTNVSEGGTTSWFSAKLARAAMYRQRGNDYFKQENLRAATSSYRKALEWLACPDKCAFDAAELEQVHAISVPSEMNLATCYWKQSRLDRCIEHCDRVLDVDAAHTKARYRRSQALLQTKEFELAIEDLERLVKLEPQSDVFVSALDRAKHAQRQQRNKEKQAFAAVFQ